MVASINKIPPEILALVPDFLGPGDRNKDIITLTHVCQTWREVFVSRSSLWVDVDCEGWEKTRVYLKRSKSLPINLSLYRTEDISPHDPLFQIIPPVTGRLKSLSVRATPGSFPAIITHLSHPVPLLEHLTIYGGHGIASLHSSALVSTLFNGDLSALRTLHLQLVRTELPWRNMVNLTSFTLVHTPPDEASLGQLLDFFEGAPRLCKIDLCFTTPTTGAQGGRLVSMVCLKSMFIDDRDLSSVLLDHLLIPVGARLTIRANIRDSLIGEHLPRSLDNLNNLSGFTTIQLYLDIHSPYMTFSGPNGKVTTISRNARIDLMLRSLAQLNASKIKRLKIYGRNTLSFLYLHQALLMTDLRTLTLSRYGRPGIFIEALYRDAVSRGALVCPKLEELVLMLSVDEDADDLDIADIIKMAAGRALRGERLRTIKIVDGQGIADLDVLELRRHVCNVEYSPWVDRLQTS